MPFSHHSHSGQFCGHARGGLEEMVQTAIKRKMLVLALTEHMPRDVEDFYPEEINEHPNTQSLVDLSDRFHEEATRLRRKYQSEIQLPIGFESEWIRPSTLSLIRSLQSKHHFDFFVGSVHHVHTIPIDFDRALYEQARSTSGGTDERLSEDYFDAQYEMLQALEPQIVGHFDLIRLFRDDPEETFQQWDGVWSRIRRNLLFVANYGGILELNSSAIRKGMIEPYPKVEICKEFLELGGRFTLSDDSHAVEQVGLNYPLVLEAILKAGIKELYYFKGSTEVSNVGPDKADFVPLTIMETQNLSFWKA